MSTIELRAIHDRLLEVMPQGVDHKEGNCPLCAVEAAEEDDTTSGGVMPETFTQADLDAAVAAAAESLQKRLAELEAQVQTTEVGKAVAAAIAEKETLVSDLQGQVDAAVAARTTAENQLTEVNQFWTDAIAAHEAEVVLASRKTERTAKAKEIGVFNDDYIAKNSDRFAAMSDEDFAARLDEWRLIAAAQAKPGFAAATSSVPDKTALVAARSEERSGGFVIGRLPELKANNVDPRTLGGVS